jgi:hypothetical protein
VDEASKDATFEAFRKSFIEAVQRRDAKFVLDSSMPDVAADLGMLARPRSTNVGGNDHHLWKELETLLQLGGSFTSRRIEGRVEFCAPYVYSAYPTGPAFDQAFPMLPWGILERDVPAYAKPDASSIVLMRLSYDLVEITGNQAPAETPIRWREIRLPSGQDAWVDAEKIRSPHDYNACFDNPYGVWKMTIFARW